MAYMEKIPIDDLFTFSCIRSGKFKFWRGVVVHHSGGLRQPKPGVFYGETIDKYHRFVKFWRRGCGYHIVISLNTHDDMRIEVSQRWINQLGGAHCIGKNNDHIGICLVGNYNKRMLPIQMEATLMQVLRKIQDRTGIPLHKIYPHHKYAFKSCPGTSFNLTQILLTVRAGRRCMDKCPEKN